jgi:hypothetical protein
MGEENVLEEPEEAESQIRAEDHTALYEKVKGGRKSARIGDTGGGRKIIDRHGITGESTDDQEAVLTEDMARDVETEAGEDLVVRATSAGGRFVHLTIGKLFDP